jgi:sarcosine oxidase subunit beta
MSAVVEGADVIVIGAGVHGASLAFHLACRGTRVVIVERSTAAGGATGRSSGLVRMHYDLPVEALLAWASFPWFRDWPDRVGGECGFVRTGFLWLEAAEMADRLRANVATQQGLGIATSFVEAGEIRRLAPALAVGDGDVAAHEPYSGYADPAATATGFLRAARDRGARLVQSAEVTAIPVAGGAVTGVETTRGAFAAPVVVDAAGGWASRVARLVDLDIPVEVWRHDTAYLGAPPEVSLPFPVVIDNANELYFRPEGSGLVLAGLEDGNEIGGSPDRDTADAAPGFADQVVDRIVRRVPGLASGTFRSAHSGQDGITPDQRPILGPAGPAGFFLDCGHSGTGFKTAPAVGLGMSELILDGAATSVDLVPFALERFAAGRLLEGKHGYRTLWRLGPPGSGPGGGTTTRTSAPDKG